MLETTFFGKTVPCAVPRAKPSFLMSLLDKIKDARSKSRGKSEDLSLMALKANFYITLTKVGAHRHADYQDICIKIMLADSETTLWYLRCEAQIIISVLSSEKHAEKFMRELTDAFFDNPYAEKTSFSILH